MKKKFILLTCLAALLFIDKAFPQHIKADTVYAMKGDRGEIKAEKLAKLLTGEGYHFSSPYGVGVRFINNGNKSRRFYTGSKDGLLKSFNSYIIPENAQVEICAIIADEKSAANFKYHIVQNSERELVPWTKPMVFRSTRIGNLSYCYLGKFDYKPAQLLKAEIYNVNDNAQNLYTVMIDWRGVYQPRFWGTMQYISSTVPQGKGLQERSLYDTARTYEPYYNPKTGKFVHIPYEDFIETRPLPDKMRFPTDIKFRIGDSLQNIRFYNMSYADLRTRGTDYKSYNFIVGLVRKIEGHADMIHLGNVTTSFELNRELWKYPGQYKLIIAPNINATDGSAVAIPNELVQTFSFTVLPPLNVKRVVPEKTVAYIILIILTTGGFMFMMYRRQQKQKLAREAQNKQIATLQLQSVRAQLNPHFIFNALAGIQNLINKNAIEDANKYLSRFARLTRNVLDEGHKDLISIEQEISLLDDYLQMEQTRFGFNFNIAVAKDIDQQIEIPAMLIQPFAENAVKHGISSLKDKGIVSINIDGRDADITLNISDNGKGFSTPAGVGKGIKLCEERIALLNSIYKKSTILLHIETGSEGTTITIHLKNWL